MDNFLIFLLIAIAIVWWDSSRRNKRIKKAKEDIGIYHGEYTYEPIEMPVKNKYDFSPEKYESIFEELMEEFKDISTQEESTIEGTVDEILKEMTSTEDINNAKKALKKLGYKNGEIAKAVKQITVDKSVSLTSSEIVTFALVLLNA